MTQTAFRGRNCANTPLGGTHARPQPCGTVAAGGELQARPRPLRNELRSGALTLTPCLSERSFRFPSPQLLSLRPSVAPLKLTSIAHAPSLHQRRSAVPVRVSPFPRRLVVTAEPDAQHLTGARGAEAVGRHIRVVFVEREAGGLL
jgi:hypothetical protein